MVAAIVSIVLGNNAPDANEQEVVWFLEAWRRRYGDGKFDELKNRVFAETDKHQADSHPNETFRRAAKQMFDRVRK